MTDSSSARLPAVKLRILGPYAPWSTDARRGRLERPDGTAADVYLVPAAAYLGAAADRSLDALRDAARQVAAWRDDGALHLKQVARVDGVDLLVFSGPEGLRSVAGLLDGGAAPLRAALQLVSGVAATADRALAARLDPASALGLDRVLVAPDGAVRLSGIVPGQGAVADTSFALGGLLLCLLLGDAGAAPQSPAQARRALIRLLSAPAGRPPDAVVDLLRAALSPEEESRPAPAGLGAALGALARGQPGTDLPKWLRDGPPVPTPAAPEPAPALPQRPLGLATGPLPDMLDDPPTTDVVEIEGRGAADGGGIDEVVPAGMRQPPRRRPPVDHTAPMAEGPGRPTDGGTEPVIEEAAAEDTEEVARENWPPSPPEKTVTSDEGAAVPVVSAPIGAGTPELRPRPPIGGGAVPAVPDHRDTVPGLGPDGPALVVRPAVEPAGPVGVGPVDLGTGAFDPDDELDGVGRPSRSGTLWAVAVVVLLLGGGAAGAWWWLGQGGAAGDGASGTGGEAAATVATGEALEGAALEDGGGQGTPSEPPSTEAPSTEAPSTEAPSTEAPSTEAPSTEAPSTEAPSTEVPVSAPDRSAPARGATTSRTAAPAGGSGTDEPDVRVRIAPRTSQDGASSRDPVLDDTRTGDAWVPPERAEPTRAVIEVSVGGDPTVPGEAAAGDGAPTAATPTAATPNAAVVETGPEPRPWTLTFRAGAGAEQRIEVTCHGGRTGSGAVVTIPDAVPGPCRVEGRAEPAGRLVAHVSVSGSAEYTCFTDGARSCR